MDVVTGCVASEQTCWLVLISQSNMYGKTKPAVVSINEGTRIP